MVSLDAVSSARRFVNVFFVDQDVDVTDAVVAVRLPYDRVNITGTDPFTFLSNDVVSEFTAKIWVRVVEPLVLVRLKVCSTPARKSVVQTPALGTRFTKSLQVVGALPSQYPELEPVGKRFGSLT